MTTTEKRDRIRLELAKWGRGYSYKWEIYDHKGDDSRLGWGRGSDDLAMFAAQGNYIEVEVTTTSTGAYRAQVSFYMRPLSAEEESVSETLKQLRREGKDPDQHRTYAFERALYDWGQEGSNIVHSEAYAQVVVESACEWANVPPPDLIKISSRIKKAGFYTRALGPNSEQRIVLRPRQELHVWLHETTHYILDAQSLECWHTAKFRKLVLDLYHHFDDSFVGSPLGALEIAKLIGVDIDWTYAARKYEPKDHIMSYNGSYAL